MVTYQELDALRLPRAPAPLTYWTVVRRAAWALACFCLAVLCMMSIAMSWWSLRVLSARAGESIWLSGLIGTELAAMVVWGFLALVSVVASVDTARGALILWRCLRALRASWGE